MNVAARPRRPWVGALLPALLVFALLVGLGTWQLKRKAWKEGLIAQLTAQLAAPPMALPAPATWPSLRQSQEEYRRVKFTATFDNAKETLVYAAPSTFRPDVSGVGYWVFTPARLSDGSYVIVNRGFVPEGRRDPATRAAGEIAGPVAIVGALRWPEERHWFSPSDDPSHNLWFVRDPVSIANAKGIKPVAPFYVEQESPSMPGGLPQPGKLEAHLRDAHLQYAVTWYGLALVLVVVFVSWGFKSRREASGTNGGPTGPGSLPSL